VLRSSTPKVCDRLLTPYWQQINHQLHSHSGALSTSSTKVWTDLPWVGWRLGGLDSRGLSGLVLTIVQGLIFSWWDVANGTVQAPVIPPLHPLGSG
jgi:hypothetical protein